MYGSARQQLIKLIISNCSVNTYREYFLRCSYLLGKLYQQKKHITVKPINLKLKHKRIQTNKLKSVTVIWRVNEYIWQLTSKFLFHFYNYFNFLHFNLVKNVNLLYYFKYYQLQNNIFYHYLQENLSYNYVTWVHI